MRVLTEGHFINRIINNILLTITVCSGITVNSVIVGKELNIYRTMISWYKKQKVVTQIKVYRNTLFVLAQNTMVYGDR